MPQNEDKENKDPVAQPVPVANGNETEEQKKKRLEAEEAEANQQKTKGKYTPGHHNIFSHLERDLPIVLNALAKALLPEPKESSDNNPTSPSPKP